MEKQESGRLESRVFFSEIRYCTHVFVMKGIVLTITINICKLDTRLYNADK